MEKHYKEMIKEIIPEEERLRIRQIIDHGFELVNQFYVRKENRFLCNPVGNDLRAHLIRSAIAFCAEREYPVEGNRFFSYIYKGNAIGNCHHIELKSATVTVLFALANSPNDTGNDSIYRHNVMENLQQNLFEEEEREENINALVVTYGIASSDEPNFVVLGIPEKKGWRGSIPLVKPDSKNKNQFITTEETEEFLAKLADNVLEEGGLVNGEKES